MSQTKVLLGPPGTGKTTTLLNRIGDLLEGGVPPEEIAFVSFTKAACTEARERAMARFCFDEQQLPYFRTVHSMALRMIGGRTAGEVMTARHWKHFAEEAVCDFTSDYVEEGTAFYLAFQSGGDQMRAIHDLSRGCLVSIEQAMLRLGRAGLSVSTADVRTFAKRLFEFKAESNLIDFGDMLERALRAPRKPPVTHAFVDEAQDLTPIQNRIVRHWFDTPRCEQLTLAGDDDQAIFTFAGADPDELIASSRSHPTEVLSQSWRIPRLVHSMAMSIVGQNRNRIEKQYKSRDGDGIITPARSAEQSLDALDGPAMALVRNRKFADDFYSAAMARALFFSCEAGCAAPLDCVAVRGAYAAVVALRAGKSATAADFAHLLDHVPSKAGDIRVLPHGAKARIDANNIPVSPDLARALGLWPFVQAHILDTDDPFRILTGLEKAEREYLTRIAARYGQKLPEKRELIITTEHKSKGREAHTVIVASDMALPSYDELIAGDTESEHRVAYVAVTRAKETLRIVEPQTRTSYPFGAHLRRVK